MSRKAKQIADDGRGRFYNFGKRKPLASCEKQLQEKIWQPLLNKWVYSQDDLGETIIFIKHIFKGNRVYQILLSGDDLWDGVYIIHTVNVERVSDGKSQKTFINVQPDCYELIFGSFEKFNYIQSLVEEGYITKEDADMFQKLDFHAKKKISLNLDEILLDCR